jgi:hypothetical protein
MHEQVLTYTEANHSHRLELITAVSPVFLDRLYAVSEREIERNTLAIVGGGFVALNSLIFYALYAYTPTREVAHSDYVAEKSGALLAGVFSCIGIGLGVLKGGRNDRELKAITHQLSQTP